MKQKSVQYRDKIEVLMRIERISPQLFGCHNHIMDEKKRSFQVPVIILNFSSTKTTLNNQTSQTRNTSFYAYVFFDTIKCSKLKVLIFISFFN